MARSEMPAIGAHILRGAARRSLAARLAAREATCRSHIPYVRQVDACTLETRSGDLLQILRLEGKSFETEDSRELDRLKTTRNTLLRVLAEGDTAVWQHIVRRRVQPVLGGCLPAGFARALDDQWQARLATRSLYVNDLYLSIVRRQPAGTRGWYDRARRMMSPAWDRLSVDRLRSVQLQALHRQVEGVIAKLAPYGPQRLTTVETEYGPQSELLRFIVQLLTGKDRPVQLPQAALDGVLGLEVEGLALDHYLPTSADYLGRDAFEMRGPGWSRYGAALAIKDYAAQTYAGMLDALYTLPQAAIVTQSFAFIGRHAALEALARQARIMDNIDDPALSQIDEIEEARDDVASGRLVYGSHHFSIMPLVERAEALDAACDEIDRRLSDLGLITVRETGGAMELARWAQLPGNFAYIARPAPISSRNFAAFASLHNYPYGRPAGNHWGPAIALLETVSGTPYFFNFHDADIGNTLVVGASGTGKTTVMGFLLAQALRTGARIVYFDKDRGADLLIRALGGRYAVIRQGRPTGFNPLQLPDSAVTRAFLARWLGTLLNARGEQLTAVDAQRVQAAVTDVFSLPPAQRRLAIIAAFFPRLSDSKLAERLAPWHSGGQYAWAFDHDRDVLALDARVIGFDLTDVLRDPVIRVPALFYMLHRVDAVLSAGSPTIIVIDEGWAALADPVFADLVEDWERTIRKRGGLVLFASQSPESITRSPVGSVIIGQSPTQLFMPNPKSEARAFEGYNLTAREQELILTLDKESRCFLVKHGRHSVVARLDLGGMDDVIAILSGRQDTVELLDQVIAEVGEDPDLWLPRFHHRRKHP